MKNIQNNRILRTILSIFFLLFTIIILAMFFANNKPLTITDYHQTFIPCFDKQGNLRIAIRMYYLGAKPYFLAVDPNTFATESAPVENFNPRKPVTKDNSLPYYTMSEVKNTPYMKALLRYSSPPYELYNYGLTEANQMVKGQFLTIDMCPSVKPFEREFFIALIDKKNSANHPVPVSISITGLWIIGHPKEFNWLIQQEKENKLQITWVNHSFSHVYYKDLPFKDNFLLTPHTNIPHEILDTEKLLIANRQLPSVFFRFPGLISNQQLILTLNQFGLIPVGSNAWLAHEEQVKMGSIILVHGNSNEPEGIKKVMPLLQHGALQLLPLNKALGLELAGKVNKKV